MTVFLRNKWGLVALVTLAWALSSTLLATYYFFQLTSINERIKGELISVNVGFDYGNGTRVWFNGTQVLKGMSLFDITRRVANLSYTIESQYGVVIHSINAVNNSFPNYWIWWRKTDSTWIMGELAPDAYLLAPGETILWYFEDASSWPLPKPR